jgi:hypothetical protein
MVNTKDTMIPAGDYESLSAEAIDKLGIPELNNWKKVHLGEYAKGMIILCSNAIETLQQAKEQYSNIIKALGEEGE